MFKKILIANRGEIACRVIRTARAMGIQTVAVYSDADDGAVHMRMADEAVHIGPAAAAESYLIIDKIIDACKKTGAEAVHPGYGFLSENQAFADALDAAGIAFIGPGKKAIASMGDKIASKKLAHAAGVNTVPGHMDLIDDADHAVKISKEIGYPVMIKASAGGGGKGMRIAHNDEEAREGFQSAKNEAISSFGDDRIFIEKFVVDPRHIEIQVLADKHGTCLYLGERECSIQRRHQKVIEEAPSPFVDDELRKAMGEQAVALSREVDYHSAGTVEFIVGSDRNFYFLEMNTRLQVEHPVTELITGIDLVEQMIRVAYGEKLSLAQEDIKLTGWALESRLYAEDPYRGFLPSIGRLSRYKVPKGENVRVDTGVTEGSEITMFYDPMIAKLVTYGETRDAAIEEMGRALDAYEVSGISHNINFLNAVCNHRRFKAGNLTTGFIAEEYPDGFHGAPLSDETVEKLVAMALLVHMRASSRSLKHVVAKTAEDWIVSEGKERSFAVSAEDADKGIKVTLGDKEIEVISNWKPGKRRIKAKIDGDKVIAQLEFYRGSIRLTHGGAVVELSVRRPAAARLAELMPVKVAPDMSKFLLCPMPGMVVAVNVKEGDEVKAGQALAVVEAMKMENILRAEQDAVVSAVKAGAGDVLAVDDVILEFE
ncbi:MAG: acetyl/propionyl-CoA carboxylase subunit alpha [Sneathiella sp.]|jgi:propionyl-CoA carboxylase alpha chain|uniref:acetyl-CoA carboxylase biotin carboxylase subunit n=1 Tax=Sneathiella sp. TaxID=1964365 RepID=UPI000C5B3B80|nr:acetyl/propionyl/methylcrotonyl-CoA carboxylase subunit alpha [Sneathiella sp.]MAL79812.1 acetyl/propionyl-CoA carboxylase subunit alpha [Sneathiella sp.]